MFCMSNVARLSARISILSYCFFVLGCLHPVKEQSAPIPVSSDAAKLIESNISSLSANPSPSTPTSEYFSKITSGYNHTCAKTSTGRLKCWGSNEFGQLGTGDTNTYSKPVLVIGSGVVDIAAGGDTTCAILTNGLLKCWGRNDFGQTGKKPQAIYSSICGSTFCTLLPNTVITSGITMAAVGDSHVCAASNTTLKCWGNNDRGQLGVGYDIDHLINPNNTVLIAATEIPQAVFKAEYTDCSSYTSNESDGSMSTSSGGSETSGATYVCSANALIKRPAYVVNVLQLSASAKHTCAIMNVSYQYLPPSTSDGTLQFRTVAGFSCWGDNTKNQLPLDTLYFANAAEVPQRLNYPYVIMNIATNILNLNSRVITSLQAGGAIQGSINNSYTCYLSKVGHSYQSFCFGDNSTNQQGSTTTYSGQNFMGSMPITFPSTSGNLMQIATMGGHACAVSSGTIVFQPSCWGNNSNGQAGVLTPSVLPAPQILAPSSLRVIQFSGGLKHTCYLNTSHTLKCFGDNSKGQLGGTGLGGGSEPNEVSPTDDSY